MDTSINYSDYNTAYFSSDEQYWIRRIRKLANDYPELVKITQQPEENYGVICATFPPRLFSIRPKLTRKITSEESDSRRQRMKKLTDLQRETGMKKVKLD